mgnify:CR=1 FL=1
MLKGYILGQINILNIDMYKQYAEKVPKIIENYAGKYLVRAGKVTDLDGKSNGSRNVVIEFESVKNAKSFYYSDEYQSIINLRVNSSEGYLIIVEGI